MEDNELDKNSVTEKCSLTADDGNKYDTNYDNEGLDKCNYICKIATIEEMNKKWNYEISIATKKKIGLFGKNKTLKIIKMVKLFLTME